MEWRSMCEISSGQQLITHSQSKKNSYSHPACHHVTAVVPFPWPVCQKRIQRVALWFSKNYQSFLLQQGVKKYHERAMSPLHISASDKNQLQQARAAQIQNFYIIAQVCVTMEIFKRQFASFHQQTSQRTLQSLRIFGLQFQGNVFIISTFPFRKPAFVEG